MVFISTYLTRTISPTPSASAAWSFTSSLPLAKTITLNDGNFRLRREALSIKMAHVNPPFTAVESSYQLHFYLCFKTHYRRQILDTERDYDLVSSVLNDVCQREQIHLLESNINEDNLGLMISLRPEQKISHVVKMFKGNLAHEFGVSHKDILERNRTQTLWAKGYHAQSSGTVNLETVRNYVEKQASHHQYKGKWTAGLSFRNRAFVSPAFSISHCLTMLDYHIVLSTQGRWPVFDESIASNLFEYVMRIGRRHMFVVDRFTVLPDHLHLIIEAVPNSSVEECVLAIMNNTQQWMLKHYSGVIKATGAWNLWQPSFYAGTIGKYSTAQVRRFLGKA